jgi:hypothetical protein
VDFFLDGFMSDFSADLPFCRHGANHGCLRTNVWSVCPREQFLVRHPVDLKMFRHRFRMDMRYDRYA